MSSVNTHQTDSKGRPIIKLPKLMEEEEIKREIRNFPNQALEGLVRTPDELEEAIEVLSRCPMRDYGYAEALILALKTSGGHYYRQASKIIEWYATGGRENHPSDFCVMRVFRFLLEQEYPATAVAGNALSCRICNPSDDVINQMVRKWPWLYWCDDWYQTWLKDKLSSFIKYHSDRQYSKSDWQEVERVVRRIVTAGDWERSQIISEILELHEQGKTRLDPNEADAFEAGRIKTLLANAKAFLETRRLSDQKHDIQEFGLAMKKKAGLQSSVLVQITNFRPYVTVNEDRPVPIKLEVKVACADPDEISLLEKHLFNTWVTLEIEGGYIVPTPPNLKPSGSDVALREGTLQFNKAGELVFYFIPFVGRHRLSLTCTSDKDDPESDPEAVKVWFFVEALPDRTSKEETAS